MLRRSVIVAVALCALSAAALRGQDTFQQEVGLLASLLKWQSGDAVAEIGAGGGKLTRAAAQRVGSAGKVYATELDPEALTHLQELANREINIVAVKAGEA